MLIEPFKASFIVGGQFGSEGKGAVAAYFAMVEARAGRAPSYITTNAGAQAGHTSIHEGRKLVSYHLPTAWHIFKQERKNLPPIMYLNAGSIISVPLLLQELAQDAEAPHCLRIHPDAAVISELDAGAEALMGPAAIGSTQKGVGSALSRKIMRTAKLARDCEELQPFIVRIDLNSRLAVGCPVLVEVPQGQSLSINGGFYPHTTSRDCNVTQAMNDAGIHPRFMGKCVMVMRTYPIRVGHSRPDVVNEGDFGHSGPVYPDQRELTWEMIGRPPEFTTVTKRMRRVFSFSAHQLRESMSVLRPDVVVLTFCDYLDRDSVVRIADAIRETAALFRMNRPEVLFQYGPTTADMEEHPRP